MSYQNELASQNARENQIKVETKKEEQKNDVEFKKNVIMEKTKKINEQPMAEQEPQFRTVKARINGEDKNIILACHKYSMETLKTSQMKRLEHIDKTKMLDVIFHVAEPEIFYEAGVELKDYDDNIIPAGTPNVYVPIETADTFYRFRIDDVLKAVKVHKFNNIQEFAETTGISNLFSRGLTSKEKIGVAALATNDEVCNAIYDMAVATNMPASTAQHYLDVNLKGSTISMMSTGYRPKDMCSLGRTLEEATLLHQKVCLTFGVNEAKKRYAIRAINYVAKSEGYSLEQILNALDTIPANEVEKAKLMECGHKETCLVTTLILWIKELEKHNQDKQVA